MIFNVVNKDISVGEIRVTAIASSSLLLIGDARTIQMASALDTPPETVTFSPLVPFSPRG
ncbi:spore gernimation protein GerPD [Peribacillus sp. SCS-37]|uniref:spore gernimation protein GerPD n=1 Tax=Paraperibacillus esterisolvens TaxID=3115296 RepID=UPI003905AECC